MAFGNETSGDRGSWTYKPPKATEGREDPPATQPPVQPAQTSPPAASHTTEVTPESIWKLGASIFPSNKDATEFAGWRREVLGDLTEEILRKSGIDPTKIDATLNALTKSIEASRATLDTKVVNDPPAPEPCPDQPCGCVDPTCRSLFDVNELAIRGRKAVTKKRFYIPMIFPELVLDVSQRWGFGQKVEYDQEWRHEGFTLGSLISSFSLLPTEEVTIEVSSWQKTKSEIQQEQDTTRRDALEQELKRTDEQSISNEAANESGWSLSATASVSYGPVSASASASANGSASDRAQEARKTVQESTTKAASEVSSRRSVKVAYTSESGSELKNSRRIRNPNECHTVTYNFFQVIKLIDMQMRFINDAPVLYFPGLFPARYTDGRPVEIPYALLEGFTAPALFLTQFFDIDRDLSQEVHGFALRVRMDIGKNPGRSLRSLTEALVVATKYLLHLDPKNHRAALAEFIASYVQNAISIRTEADKSYGAGKGESLQVNSPGIYVDSLLGRCSACEDTLTARKIADIRTIDAARKQVEAETSLVAIEHQRRTSWQDKSTVDPFAPATQPSP